MNKANQLMLVMIISIVISTQAYAATVFQEYLGELTGLYTPGPTNVGGAFVNAGG